MVGWLGSVVKVVAESAVIWLLTGFVRVRGAQRIKKKTLNQHQWQCVCYVYVRGFISLNLNFFAFFLLFSC